MSTNRFQVTPRSLQFWIDSGDSATVTNIGSSTVYGGADEMFPTISDADWSLAAGESRTEGSGSVWVRTASGASSSLTVEPIASGTVIDLGSGAPISVGGGDALPAGGPGVLTRATEDGTPVWGRSLDEIVLIADAPSGDATGATDTAHIQGLLNEAAAAGGGVVQLRPAPPSAPYFTTQLKVRTYVELVGVSRWGTVLRAPLGQAASPAGDMIRLWDDLTYGWAVRRLTLDGQDGKGPVYGGTSSLQSNAFWGISIDVTTSQNHFDPYGADMTATIEDVSAVQMGFGGVDVNRACSEVRLRGVYCISNHWTGFRLGYADLFIEGCTAGANGAHGFWIGGSLNQFTNCKAWWNGWRLTAPSGTDPADFYISGSANVFSSCFAQDGYVSGWSIKGQYNRIDGTVAGGLQQCVLLQSGANDNTIHLTANPGINNGLPAHLLTHTPGGALRNNIHIDGVASETGTKLSGSSLTGNDVSIGPGYRAYPVRAAFPESGNYFTTPGMSPSGGAGTENLLTATPVIVGRDTTISALVAKVETGGGGSSTVRLGVYADDGNFYPGARLLDAGTVATATTGLKEITGLSLRLLPGRLYWLVGVVVGGGGAVAQMSRAAVAGAHAEYMGANGGNAGFLFANQANDAVVGFSEAGVTGALPATFTTTRTQQVGYSGAGNVILVAARAT